MAKSTNFRVKFVIDDQASFEECNGEARPLTAEEYEKEGVYMACPNHPRGPKGDDTAVNGVGTCARCGSTYTPVPYDEYLAYYGNPDRHIYLGCIVEKQCPCCEAWSSVQSLWHIDFMDDDRAYVDTQIEHWYTPAQAKALPDYVGTIANELLSEAGYKTPRVRKAR